MKYLLSLYIFLYNKNIYCHYTSSCIIRNTSSRMTRNTPSHIIKYLLLLLYKKVYNNNKYFITLSRITRNTSSRIIKYLLSIFSYIITRNILLYIVLYNKIFLVIMHFLLYNNNKRHYV